MKPLMLICPLLIFFDCFGQGEKVINDLQQENAQWYDGTLFLNNETELKGKIRYNDKNGALSYRTAEGSESYSANTVIRFVFFDEESREYRNFISLDYPLENLRKGTISSFSVNDAKNNFKDDSIMPTFFEVLRETNQFVLLSKVKPIEYKEKTKRYGVGAGATTAFLVIKSDEVKQSEFVFFLTQSGVIVPYLEFRNKEVVDVFNEDGKKKTKKKTLDENALEYVAGALYSQLMTYAETNKLKTTRKEDLLKIIDYYISIQK